MEREKQIEPEMKNIQKDGESLRQELTERKKKKVKGTEKRARDMHKARRRTIAAAERERKYETERSRER